MSLKLSKMQLSVIFFHDIIFMLSILDNMLQHLWLGVCKDKWQSCILLQRSAEGSSAEDGEGKCPN